MTRMPVGPPSQNIIFSLIMQALRYTARQVATSIRLLAAADPACCLANAPLAQQAVMQQPWGQQRCWSSGNADSQGSAPLTGDTYSAASLVPETELAVIRQRIFGTHIGNNLSSGRKARQYACSCAHCSSNQLWWPCRCSDSGCVATG